MRWKRLAVGAAAAAMLAGLFVVAPSVVTPEKAPQAAAHQAYTNGCTAVPDEGSLFWSPWWWSFHDECDQHDLCYVYKWYGNSELGRARCDSMFYGLMVADANRQPNWANRVAVLSVASTYYTGVKWFGRFFFYSSDPLVRANTRMA